MRFASAFFLFALPAALPCSAETLVGSGHPATTRREVTGFAGLSVSVPARVELVQGADEGVSVTADDNVLPRVRTFVDHGVLRVRFPSGLSVRPRTPIAVTVHARSIGSIVLAGSAHLTAPRLETDRLAVELAGSAAITLPQVAARRLSIHTSGHCHAMAAGRVGRFELHMAGAGEVNAARLEAARARVRIAGSAQVALWARERLEVGITGSAAVRYFGDPVVQKTLTGSGLVERLGASPP